MSANAPTILNVFYQSPDLEVRWIMAGTGPTTPFLVTVKDVQSGATTDYPAQGLFARITQALTAGTPYTVTVALNEGTVGTPSTPVPIITVAPVVTLVENTGSGLQLRWNALQGFTTYSAVLQEGGKVRSQLVTGTEWLFPGQLRQPAVTAVSAATTDGVSIGPVTQTYAPILEAVTMRTVQNSGSGLLLVWNLVTGRMNYQAALQEGSGTPNVQSVVGPTYEFSDPLTGAEYSTWVRIASADGVELGPPGTVYHPILAAATPVMTRVENTSAALLLTWDRAEAYNRYVAVLAQTGHQTLSKSVTALDCSFDLTLTGSGWLTNVSAQSDDQILIGPPSTTYAPIIDQPALTELDYLTGAFTLVWNTIAGTVTGYVVQIGGPVGTNEYPVPDGGLATLPVTLEPVTYSVVIRAANGIVLGPWSATRIPLTAKPHRPKLLYDGAHLIGYWMPSGQQNVSGYILDLKANGTTVQQATPSASPQPFESDLTNGVVFTMQVRATGTGTKGPWSDLVPGPYGAAMVYTYDAIGRIHTVQWNSVSTQTYAFDTAGNIQSVEYTTS